MFLKCIILTSLWYYINILITVMVIQSIINQAGPAQDPWPHKPKPSRPGEPSSAMQFVVCMIYLLFTSNHVLGLNYDRRSHVNLGLMRNHLSVTQREILLMYEDLLIPTRSEGCAMKLL